ncbi:MAG TPA: bacillithiol biosynthesis cysteine-adding enzyme BshC [Spirochaetia bacterium]|nr:bacillithiol biosynthesis cysteine-adding enzyme BshC [Spirochaetia bacterium]
MACMVHSIALASIPATSRLFADYCEGGGRIRELLPRHFKEPGAFAAQARLLDGRSYDRRSLCGILKEQNEHFGAAAPALAAIARLENPASVVAIGGQQAGLFGGPLYTLHKALTILETARRAEAELGRPVVPLFWIASEDSDLAEVDHAWITNREGELEMLRMPSGAPAKIPVSRVRLGDAVGPLLDRLAASLPEGDPAARVMADLRAAYTPGRTYPQSFAAWMAALFGPLGLGLVDPSDSRLKRLAHDLFATEITGKSPVSSAVLEQTGRLRAAGYEPQIELRDGFLTLFHQDPVRDAITVTPRGFELKASGRKFTPGELSDLLERSPETFTPNAVMRPLFQDTMFPTLAVVLGPAEVAYFCQLTLAYERMGIPMPLLVPRCSVTLVEYKVERLRRKLDVTLEQVIQRGDRLLDDILRREIPPALTGRITEGRAQAATTWNALVSEIDTLDPTLHRTALIGAARAASQFDFIERKIAQAARRKNELVRRQVQRLTASLAPRGGLQERTLCAPPLLGAHGGRIIEAASSVIDPFVVEHRAVVLEP